jgi:hypothetical protein
MKPKEKEKLEAPDLSQERTPHNRHLWAKGGERSPKIESELILSIIRRQIRAFEDVTAATLQ